MTGNRKAACYGHVTLLHAFCQRAADLRSTYSGKLRLTRNYHPEKSA